MNTQILAPTANAAPVKPSTSSRKDSSNWQTERPDMKLAKDDTIQKWGTKMFSRLERENRAEKKRTNDMTREKQGRALYAEFGYVYGLSKFQVVFYIVLIIAVVISVAMVWSDNIQVCTSPCKSFSMTNYVTSVIMGIIIVIGTYGGLSLIPNVWFIESTTAMEAYIPSIGYMLGIVNVIFIGVLINDNNNQTDETDIGDPVIPLDE